MTPKRLTAALSANALLCVCVRTRNTVHDCVHEKNVVSMNVVDVDDRYGPYGSCNLNKKTGKYACICSKGKPCTGEVGQVAVSTREIAPGMRVHPFAGHDWHL